METELNPGDRVHWIGRPGTFVVEPLAQHRVQIRSEQEGTIFTPLASELTRIEPAEPQPKYRVGQGVRQRSTGEQAIVGEILHPISYKVKWPDGGENQYGEDDLEAVPGACPTCGGKGVADG